MPTEIERKFLVRGDGWREGARAEDIRQGYLARGEGVTVRVRRKGQRGFLTVKGARSGIARAEYEYEIPAADADALLALCARPLIEKTRHHLRVEGVTWEIDEFRGANAGLILAEIELEHADAPFERPHWLGREVTHDRRFDNASLARSPFDPAWLKD